MKTWAQAIDLKDDPKLIEQYKLEHTRVWPEVLAQIRAQGILQMKIWVVGTHMFMYMETEDDFDPKKNFGETYRSGRSAEWNKWMSETFQQRLPEAKEGEWWASMDLAFDLKAALGEPTA